jgi:simple sugar transport system ATP-binding protein
MSDSSAHHAPALELRGASCHFGALRAVDRVDLRVVPGELAALVGENGAGKSTAMKLFAGHLAPTQGRVLVDEHELRPATPGAAMALGIGMVHQHFKLVEAFTALENLVLGSEPVTRWGVLDLGRARARATSVAERAGLSLDLEAPTAALSVGERQRLEILRVLYRGARAILLDEPTAVLSPVEVDELYRMLRALSAEGATVLVVTHRLDEVVRFCDRVTVLRRGQRVHAEAIAASTRADGSERHALSERLTRAIMGGSAPEIASAPALAGDARARLELADVSVAHERGLWAVRELTLSVRAGEIVGVAGVEGNGQRELVRALAGIEPLAHGSIALDGETLFAGRSARAGDRARAVGEARRRGLVVVHEDRQEDEVMLDASLADNLVLGDLGTLRDEDERVAARLARFDVTPAEPERLVRELSGGNQQKLVMGRALDRPLAALVLAQPTRGVDIGTARIIHNAIVDAARSGTAVLIVSADLGELRSLSHRILVMRRGAVVAEHDPGVSDETIGRAMLGTEAA